MFGAFSRLLGNFWEGLYPEEDENTESVTSAFSNCHESASSSQRGNFVSTTNSEKLHKRLSGKVTKLYDEAGLIDEEIYFTFDKVIGGLRPKLDAEVHVEASRKSTKDGWRADRVEVLLTDWNSFGEEGTSEVVIGEVTDVTEENLIVNYDTFCHCSCVIFGYVPCKGDWVRVELRKDRGVVCEVKSVGPLREKNITGSITSVGHGHGYINKDVFFSFETCKRGYTPRKGHTVSLTAIESNQGNCKWRAISVEPKGPRRGAGNLVKATPPSQSKFREELMHNKQGVTITDQVNFGAVVVGRIQEKIICIRNNGECVAVLKSIEGIEDYSAFTIELNGKPTSAGNNVKLCGPLEVENQTLDVKISPQCVLNLTVKVNSRFLGEVNQLVIFNFGSFQIGRYFVVNIQDVEQQLLNAKAPYSKRQFTDQKNALGRVIETRNNQQWVIPGERPMFRQGTINISFKLKQYEIPRTLRRYILEKMDLCCVVPSLGESLSMRNYQERFSTLLHVEEVQMELQMREFDLEQVSLKSVGEFLSLSVPGLAEGRPSLLIGDRVILAVSGASPNSPKYEGFIHEVLSDEILLKFHDEFHITYDMDSYDVMFFFNRTPLRRAHRAVEMANYLGDKVLFPTYVLPTLPQSLCKSKSEKEFFNAKLNERQRAAVRRILSGQCRPMPYVLFGPPGTGKTVTLVEAILQVFHRVRSSRILACAPSNSAADLIAERLHHSGAIAEGDMVRLNAFQRQQNIPEDIENYSTNIEKLDMAAHYRILICTCTTAGQLHTLGLPPGHFTHVFIDEGNNRTALLPTRFVDSPEYLYPFSLLSHYVIESVVYVRLAGQATEPESLVPISFLVGTDGQTILGGDPYQLGAVLRSTLAQSYGLNISLLERLMDRTPYLRNEKKFSNHGCYDPLTVTKLVNNYRSHEALLELPSRLFYHSELVPCAGEDIKTCLCHWDTLPNKRGFPMIFHGVKGEDLREGNSPSWFNAVEAVQVIRYIQELRSFEKYPVKLSDIGIITPYRKQVEKIRLLLERLGISQVKVGSVEEFQGQERPVIIISTVRSAGNLLGFDVTHNLGFLRNPKRFNVAITRAQALMIIVGNPHVLAKDDNWRALLQYSLDNNAYIGCDLPDLDQYLDDSNRENGYFHDNSPPILASERENNEAEFVSHVENNVSYIYDEVPALSDQMQPRGLSGSNECDIGTVGQPMVVSCGNRSEVHDYVSRAGGTQCTDKNKDTRDKGGEFRQSGGCTEDNLDDEGEYTNNDDSTEDNLDDGSEYFNNDDLSANSSDSRRGNTNNHVINGDNLDSEGEHRRNDDLCEFEDKMSAVSEKIKAVPATNSNSHAGTCGQRATEPEYRRCHGIMSNDFEKTPGTPALLSGTAIATDHVLNRKEQSSDRNLSFNKTAGPGTSIEVSGKKQVQSNESSDEELEEIVYIPDLGHFD